MFFFFPTVHLSVEDLLFPTIKILTTHHHRTEKNGCNFSQAVKTGVTGVLHSASKVVFFKGSTHHTLCTLLYSCRSTPGECDDRNVVVTGKTPHPPDNYYSVKNTKSQLCGSIASNLISENQNTVPAVQPEYSTSLIFFIRHIFCAPHFHCTLLVSRGTQMEISHHKSALNSY